jgi:hypothetical protein
MHSPGRVPSRSVEPNNSRDVALTGQGESIAAGVKSKAHRKKARQVQPGHQEGRHQHLAGQGRSIIAGQQTPHPTPEGPSRPADSTSPSHRHATLTGQGPTSGAVTAQCRGPLNHRPIGQASQHPRPKPAPTASNGHCRTPRGRPGPQATTGCSAVHHRSRRPRQEQSRTLPCVPANQLNQPRTLYIATGPGVALHLNK